MCEVGEPVREVESKEGLPEGLMGVELVLCE